MSEGVEYNETFSRNIGFVSEAEQERLRDSCVLVIGAGGMGGAAIESLVRSGLGQVIAADPDSFELSNLNRQVFSDLSLLGKSKVESARAACLAINPSLKFEARERITGSDLRRAIRGCDVVINGCDDARMTLELHREAASQNKTVIDALAASLPNVVVCPPGSGGIERLLSSPCVGIELSQLDGEILQRHARKEIEYVMIHSSSLEYVDLKATREFLAGKRKRFSFAPMVISTGNLMAFEALRVLLHRNPIKDHSKSHVYFLNPWTCEIERPKTGAALVKGMYAAWRFSTALAED